MMERIKEEGLLVQALQLVEATTPSIKDLIILGSTANLLETTIVKEIVLL